MGIYEYSVERPDGTMQPLSAYEGKVLLIVNTATGCGFTPQYQELEEFYRKYHGKGLEILDIPCNQFAGQTPGTDEEIHEFCTLKYHTEFPQMKKSDVNGEHQLPLYAYLKSKKGFAGFGKGKPLLCRIIKFCVIKEQPSNKTASITAAVPTQRKPAGSICKSAATGQ